MTAVDDPAQAATSISRLQPALFPGGAPAPDPARVATIRNAIDLTGPSMAATFGEPARLDVLNLIERALAETRTGDLTECSSLLAHARSRLAALDPNNLEKRRGVAGWFDSRGRRLKAFRTAFCAAAAAMAEAAGDVADRSASVARRNENLEGLWSKIRTAILELDACIEAGLIRLATEPVPTVDEDGVAPSNHPLAGRLALLAAARNAAVRQLPLVRMAQNADCRIPDQLKTLTISVSSWRDDWGQALGLNRKRPRKVRPDTVMLAQERAAMRLLFETVEADLIEARTRRARAETRMAQLAESVRRAA